MDRKAHDLSRETLNLPHMMGLPNRALEPISRSWSFCANDIEVPIPHRICGSGDNSFGIARTLIPQG